MTTQVKTRKVANLGLLVIVLSSCGGGTKTVFRTLTAPPGATAPSASQGQTSAAAPTTSPNCASLPNPRTYKGKCVVNGTTLTYVNKGDTARIRSLAAKLNGVSTAS